MSDDTEHAPESYAPATPQEPAARSVWSGVLRPQVTTVAVCVCLFITAGIAISGADQSDRGLEDYTRRRSAFSTGPGGR